MKRRLLLVLMAFLFIPLWVNASVYNLGYRSNKSKNNKTILKVNDAEIHFTAWLSANLETVSDSNYKSDEYLINNISVTNRGNGDVLVSIKRSEINKILKENKFENVSTIISIHGDYLDLVKGNKYYMFSRGSGSSGYWYETYDQNYEMRTYNVLEVYNGAGNLVGTQFNELATNYGGMYIYQTDEYPTYDNSRTYNLDEFKNNANQILGIASTGVQVRIIEDEKIDVGENKIVNPTGEINKDGTHEKTEIKEVEMKNFYAEYDSNSQLSYSWTLYDEEGNPLEINFDTAITIDESENEEEIMAAAEEKFDNLDGKATIITFSHDGELGGVAKIKLYVGDKFQAGNKVRLYYYDPTDKSLSLQSTTDQEGSKPIEVIVDQDGYVELTFTHCSEYLLTDVAEKDTTDVKKEKDNTKIIIIGSSIAVVAIATVSVIIVKKKKASKI